MRALIERILALLPWYDPAALSERRRDSAAARRQAMRTRRAIAEVQRLELVARRHR